MPSRFSTLPKNVHRRVEYRAQLSAYSFTCVVHLQRAGDRSYRRDGRQPLFGATYLAAETGSLGLGATVRADQAKLLEGEADDEIDDTPRPGKPNAAAWNWRL